MKTYDLFFSISQKVAIKNPFGKKPYLILGIFGYLIDCSLGRRLYAITDS